MSIPLDRLYTHLNDLCNHDNIVISRWHPHGSKKACDLNLLRAYPESSSVDNRLGVICHDQEPLNFKMYEYADLLQALKSRGLSDQSQLVSDPDFKELIQQFHLRALIGNPVNCYDQTILVHSELASPEVATYANHDFIPVYWWAHGVIAQDWFRYAQFDKRTMQYPDCFDKTFLIYCRAWSGTRQYRLNFLQDIKNNNLQHCSLINFSAWDDGQHYSDFVPDKDFELCFAKNTVTSSASADYSSDDYHRCAIEVVFETVYESSRIHLTEKTCRPLACGKPFILASGPGSLGILRNYGFETFAPWIDESYDLETNIDQRRTMIIQEMQRLSTLPKTSSIWSELHRIAARNRNKFLSKDFTHTLINEFETNINAAFQQVTDSGKYINIAKNFTRKSQYADIIHQYMGTNFEFCQ